MNTTVIIIMLYMASVILCLGTMFLDQRTTTTKEKKQYLILSLIPMLNLVSAASSMAYYATYGYGDTES